MIAYRTAAPFAVIVKPVGARCNMRCRYCYYLEKEQTAPVMTDAVLEKLIRDTVEGSPGPVVSFTWHGGEPTLAGIEFFHRAVGLERKYLPRGWQAWNSLQTNGLLLDDAWCAFLRDYGFDVGLSIDGNAAIHDRNRRDAGGCPTYAGVRQAVGRLKAHGIQPDLLCTVTADTLADPLGVYRALRDMDTGWIQFIPVMVRRKDGTPDPVSVTPEGYGDFLCTVFDEWVRHDLGRLDVQLFAETSRVWAGGAPGVCHMAPVCGRVPVVEADGSVYACDHFVEGSHRLGSVRESPLAELVDSAFQRAFGRGKRDTLTRECRECPWLAACGGGCPKDRFGVSVYGEAGQYDLCPGLKAFFAHAHGPLHAAMAMSRQGRTPEEIMSALQKE